QKLLHTIHYYHIEAIAIGNGTASRETEAFVRSIDIPPSLPIILVNEAGASVYSASEAAREEFPELDLTFRSAISIGRRLLDPLAELVKIDPKSIGVGQYQHDVDQQALQRALDDTVISCVNLVGVELNTASRHLLTYVSGLNARTASAIVSWRDANGPFRSRFDLLKVPGIGPKTFEQAAGFLRIHNASNPLDSTAVHPERYQLVEQIAKDLQTSIHDLIHAPSLRAKINPQRYLSHDVGLPTINDILAELAKPGRDPRQQFEAFSFSNEVHSISDLKPGMRLPGIVTNVAAFGAFVDIGVHQDGLVHISQLADHYVKKPSDIVKPGQRVIVTVLEVDLQRRRISLSLRSKPANTPPPTNTKKGSRPSTNHKMPPDEPLDWFTLALNRKL
ncbi:MAG: helix-hairpin-helix domain-containing protein, partial [Chthoniobacterales bacterium]|nr:helix-hairpin-helix domain-containing protein [Chthoniobacterales bacterium]